MSARVWCKSGAKMCYKQAGVTPNLMRNLLNNDVKTYKKSHSRQLA